MDRSDMDKDLLELERIALLKFRKKRKKNNQDLFLIIFFC